METREHAREHAHGEAWRKGSLVGQRAPLKPKDIWAIRIHLQNGKRSTNPILPGLAPMLYSNLTSPVLSEAEGF